MRYRMLGLWLSLLLGFVPLSYAMDLYTAEVKVNSRSEEARNQALEVALTQVLAQVSGNPQASQAEALKARLANASQWVEFYRYETQAGQSFLKVRFDEQAINELLRKSGFTPWEGESLSRVVFWVTVDKAGQRFMVGEENLEPELQSLNNDLKVSAKAAGIDIIIPQGDAEDRTAVTSTDLWGGFTQQLAEASQRYDAPAWVVLKIQLLPEGEANIDWEFTWGTAQIKGNEQGPFSFAIDKIMQDLEQAILKTGEQRAAVQTEPIVLVVKDIYNLESYEIVTQFLTKLPQVRNVETLRFETPTVAYRINTGASVGALEDLLAGAGFLFPADAPEGAAELNTLYYRYVE